MKKDYWLGKPAKDVVSNLEKYDAMWRGTRSNPFYEMWFRNSYAYYSNVLDVDSVVSSLNFRGDKGELVEMKVPQARSLVRQSLTLMTKQRLNFQCLATLDSFEYIQNIRRANAIIQDEVDNQGLEMKRDGVGEKALVLGTGYYACLHRFDRGREIGVNESGGLIYEGEPEILDVHPMDYLYDYRITPFTDTPWGRLRVKRLRYDLIALYPELTDKILGLPSCWEVDGRYSEGMDQFQANDMVYEYHVFHRKTPALKNGRYICYASVDCVFFDDDNFYDGIPVEPVVPEGIFSYGIGYPLLSSLLPAQEMYDHEYSAVATNHAALAIRNIAVPRNASVAIKAIPGGLNLIQYTPQNVPGGGKPEVLSFETPSTDAYNFQDKLLSNMQQMTSLNAAVRGEATQANSGVAIATLTTNALEFLNGYSKALYIATENILYWKIRLLQKLVKEPKAIMVMGENNLPSEDHYVGDHLKAVRGVKIVATNPMMQTMNGRMTIADQLLGKGLIKSAQEYISVLDGAPTQRLYGKELSENDLIQFQKEQLLRGEAPTVIATDNHPRMIQEANSLLNNPAARRDPKVTKAVTDYIMEHLRQAQTADPMLMAMATTGLMPQGGPPPGGGEAPPPAPAEGGDTPKEGGGPAQAPLGMEAPASPTGPAHDMLGRA